VAKRKSANGINKSALIREYMAVNPSAKPKAVAEALSAQHGIAITPQAVSMTKANDKKTSGKKPGRRGRKPRSMVAASSGVGTGNGFAPQSFASAMPIFKAASELLKVAGDRAVAREVLDMVAALRG
jgi:uncharacterized MAPEG superfamily protein